VTQLLTKSLSASAPVGLICGIGAALLWAVGYVATRHGLDVGFSPADLAIHRFTWSGLAFLPLVMRAGITDLAGIGWGRGLLLALLGGTGFSFISFSGFPLVPLGHAGVIQPSSITLGGVILATIVLREKLVTTRMIGAAIIVCGLGVIGSEAVSTIGTHGVAGDLIFVLTGLMYAAFSTLLRLWRIPATSAAAVISVLSLLPLPLFWAFGCFAHMAALGWHANVLQALVQGVLAGPAALFLYVHSVAILGAGRAATVNALVSPFILLLGWLILGSVATVLQIGGMVIVVIGFRLTQRTPKVL
jgi:drug/metabolite transporter (DMT)-like permease